jgi:1-pyrroline-5-carboxylate dehydrogenase
MSMNNGHYSLPIPVNEPILSYVPGSPERNRLKEVIQELKNTVLDVPMYIGGKEVRTNKKISIHPPHEHAHLLGNFHAGDAKHVKMAIDAALTAKASWEAMPWESRAAILLPVDTDLI